MGDFTHFETNYPIWSRALMLLSRRIKNDVRKANSDTAEDMLRTMRSHASGRPGPRAVTGAFRNAMFVEMDEDGMGFSAGNPSPQARRLETGFVGVDSLGRHYHQPAYPWLTTSREEVWPRYVERVRKAIRP